MYVRSPCCCAGQDSADGAETRYLNRREQCSDDREKRDGDGEMEARCRPVSRQLSGESLVLHMVSIGSLAVVRQTGREVSISSEAK
jgi:hypothetical protein